MTPNLTVFGSNMDIRRYRYYNYRKGYYASNILVMDNFHDNSAFNR